MSGEKEKQQENFASKLVEDILQNENKGIENLATENIKNIPSISIDNFDLTGIGTTGLFSNTEFMSFYLMMLCESDITVFQEGQVRIDKLMNKSIGKYCESFGLTYANNIQRIIFDSIMCLGHATDLGNSLHSLIKTDQIYIRSIERNGDLGNRTMMMFGSCELNVYKDTLYVSFSLSLHIETTYFNYGNAENKMIFNLPKVFFVLPNSISIPIYNNKKWLNNFSNYDLKKMKFKNEEQQRLYLSGLSEVLLLNESFTKFLSVYIKNIYMLFLILEMKEEIIENLLIETLKSFPNIREIIFGDTAKKLIEHEKEMKEKNNE